VAGGKEERRAQRLQMFRTVVRERVERMNLSWIELEQGAGGRASGDVLARELHSLKGDASLMGFASVARLAHTLEDAVLATARAGISPPPAAGDLVLRGFDLVLRLVDEDPDAAPAEAKSLSADLVALASGAAPAAPVPGHGGTDAPPVPTPSAAARTARPASGAATAAPALAAAAGAPMVRPVVARAETRPAPPPPAPIAKATGAPEAGPPAPTPAAETAVRVTPQQLDRIRDIIGDLLLKRTRLARSATELRRTRDRAAHTNGVPGTAADRTIVDALAGIESRLRDDVLGLGNLVDGLEAVTRELRMIPMRVLFDRFPRAVRDLGRRLGRQVRLICQGHDVEVDREVLEALDTPLLHLVRNAVDHGIEDPGTRQRLDKPAIGTVRMQAALVGDFIHVEVADDGAGIDVQRVRQRAIAQGLVDAATAELLSTEQTLQYLFEPGMSTREDVTEISGRGFGLDIVQAAVRQLGGTVTLQSSVGRGTTFRLSVPISVAITSVVMFRVGAERFALPASMVVTIIDAANTPIVDSVYGRSIRYTEQLIPIVELDELLGAPAPAGDDRGAARLVIAQSGPTLVALAGSRDHFQREAVLKSVRQFLEHDRLTSAGLVLEDGSLALVLNPVELLRASRTRAMRSPERRLPSTPAPPSRAAADPTTILVAEDSPVVRDLLAEALRSHGTRVLEAVDGLEALEKLEAHPEIRLLVTDIEMPRLDGFELIRRARARPHARRIPTVIVSTRGSDADKLRAVEVGADAYLVKSDFSSESLWTLVSGFLG
jgi:chemotaxis protein histidine kinase CheA